MMHDDEPMGPDLRFASPALEQRFREARLRATRRLQCWAEAMRAACWVVVALKAAAGGRNTAAAGFALGTLTSAALLALYASPGQRPLRCARCRDPPGPNLTATRPSPCTLRAEHGAPAAAVPAVPAAAGCMAPF